MEAYDLVFIVKQEKLTLPINEIRLSYDTVKSCFVALAGKPVASNLKVYVYYASDDSSTQTVQPNTCRFDQTSSSIGQGGGSSMATLITDSPSWSFSGDGDVGMSFTESGKTVIVNAEANTTENNRVYTVTAYCNEFDELLPGKTGTEIIINITSGNVRGQVSLPSGVELLSDSPIILSECYVTTLDSGGNETRKTTDEEYEYILV